MKNDTIFVQIAAYRDPELLPTIENLLATAKYPNRLHFAIAWQHDKQDKWDTLKKYSSNKNFKILDIQASTAKGVCWARAQLNTLYNKEKYTLQIDSHHRMIQDWDEVLIKMLNSVRSKSDPKPLLTSYLPAYFPEQYPEGALDEAWQMNFDYFLPEGPIFTRPSVIANWKKLKKPIRARFLSAHFVFADGHWVTNVPYDSMLYFHGEEPTLAIRSFTHGYSLFHPHKVVGWHEYTRAGKKKHWDDYPQWNNLDRISFSRVRKLLGMDGEVLDFDFGKYGLGNERSLHDYELYAGVKFSTRQVHQKTLNQDSPPICDTEEEFESQLCSRFKYCINIYKDDAAEDDYEFWAVAFKDAAGNELVRIDANAEEIKNIQMVARNENENFINLWREFETSVIPTSWLVWPKSAAKGWMPIITGTVPQK